MPDAWIFFPPDEVLRALNWHINITHPELARRDVEKIYTARGVYVRAAQEEVKAPGPALPPVRKLAPERGADPYGNDIDP
jgi:hypothetical protein